MRDGKTHSPISRGLGTIMNYGGGRHPFAHTKHQMPQRRFRGLTPDIFWTSRSNLLATPRGDLKTVIDSLVDSQALGENGSAGHGWTAALKPVHFVHGKLISGVVSELPNTPPLSFPTTSGDLTRHLAHVLIAPHSPNKDEEDGDHAILQIPLPTAASVHSNYLLYNILPKAIPFIRKHLTAGEDVCVSCPTGKDLGPGVIATALALFFGDDGNLLSDNDIDNKGRPPKASVRGSLLNPYPGSVIDKSTIRKRLQWVISSNPKVNPSRNTLKRVNEFLMSHHHHPHYVPPSSFPRASS